MYVIMGCLEHPFDLLLERVEMIAVVGRGEADGTLQVAVVGDLEDH
jgi:hypothetical protein